MKLKFLSLTTIFATTALVQPLYSQSTDKLIQGNQNSKYASNGIGKYLPENSFRYSSTFIDQKGSPATSNHDVGMSVDQSIYIGKFSYGISKKLSMHLSVPTYTKNSLTFDKNKFQQSKAYEKQQQAMVSRLAKSYRWCGNSQNKYDCKNAWGRSNKWTGN